MKSRLLPLLLVMGLVLPALASDEPTFDAELSPCRGHWVATPVTLRLDLTRLDAEGLRWLDPASFRLFLDGVEVTLPFLSLVSARGRVEWRPELAALALEAAVDLPPGPHLFELRGRHRNGPERRWWGAFTVYTPERAAPLKARLAAESPGPVLQVEDFDPPRLEISPADGAFLHASRPRLEVRWADDLSWVDPATAKILIDSQDVTARFSPANWGAAWEVPSGQELKDGKHLLVVQVKDALGNLAVASSSFLLVDDGNRAPWPFAPVNQPHVLGHTHHQYQNYSSGTSSAYFHHGIDIMPAPQAPLYACRGGKVVTFYWYGQQPYYFEIGIQDADGFTWQYHHVDEPTISQAVRDAFTNQTPLAPGIFLANIVLWPSSASSYGKVFHHVHLNVLDPDGKYINPLHMILKSNDAVKPAIGDVLFTANNANTALNSPTGPRPVLSGPVDIVARAEDLSGTEPYQLTLYLMEWAVEELGGSKSHGVPFTPLWSFDRLPGGADRYLHLFTVFKAQIYYDGSTKRTRGDYSNRIFYYILTNTVGGILDPAGAWNTAARDGFGRPSFPNGLYRVTIRATDDRGNSSLKAVEVEVRN